ncbi:MAG TPA: glycosyltransferase family 2 protein [Myxococcaceae bacterium]|nr:glycosyltransferase family 2 protein [Myxococcaceae bacterium]
MSPPQQRGVVVGGAAALRWVGQSPEPKPPEVSIVLPCLNEAQTLGSCIAKAKAAIEMHGLNAEIIVADNGSTDGSEEIARRSGASVVRATRKGYGAALMAGIEAARGEFVIMGDADDSYDFGAIYPFVEKLREG